MLIEDLAKSKNIQKNVNRNSRVTINEIKEKNNKNKNEQDSIQLIKRYTLIDISKYIIFKELVIRTGDFGQVNFGVIKENFTKIAKKRK